MFKKWWLKDLNLYKMEYPLTFRIILSVLQIVVEVVYLPIHLYRLLFLTPKKCTSIQDKILLLPASELAERIRKKELKCSSVVQSYIRRVKEVNPIINAVVEERFEEALKDAEKVDDFVENTKLDYAQIKEKYPLLGVPITVKVSIAVKGMIHSAGRPDRLVQAEEDAVTVKYARDAGAIPLLTSNTPELCMDWETRNKLIGKTSNPYNSLRTPGGSSGGEASLLGSAASVIGLGSDIAGSLRLPAHNCGIWGHKPSPHVVSTVGHYPDCKQRNEWNEVFTLGPLARYAGDLKLLLSVIAEPSHKARLSLDQKVDINEIRIFYIEDVNATLANRVSPDIIDSIRKVINHFNLERNSKCVKVKIPLMRYCAELSYLKLANIDDVENVFEGKGEGCYRELLRYFQGKSVHELNSIGYGILRNNIHFLPVKTMSTVNKYLSMLRGDLLKILGDDGVLILPTSPCEATYHLDIYRKLFNAGCLSIFNVLGFPATNCPVAFSKNNMPLGLQVVAAPNMDRLTLCVAEEIEKVFGGWQFK